MSGFGAALYDFDNDGWKDLFVSGGHVESLNLPGSPSINRIPCSATWARVGNGRALTEEAGFNVGSAGPPSRLRLR